MRHFLLSTVAFAALAGSALASDLPSTKAPPVFTAPVSVYNWTGFYLGADVGGVWGQGTFATTTTSSRVNTASVFGGGYVGYNYQINNFVLGLQGGADGFNAAGTNAIGIGMRQTYLASIDARLGYAFNNVLVYAIGGAAFTNTSHWAGTINYPGGDATGFDIGGGVEYGFLPNWTVRAEYRYYDFGRSAYAAPIIGVTVIPGHTFEKSDNTVRVGLTYKFGAPAAAAVVAKY